MNKVLVNRLGGLPRKSVVRLTDHPDMTLDVYRGRKTKIQPTNPKEQICKEIAPRVEQILSFMSWCFLRRDSKKREAVQMLHLKVYPAAKETRKLVIFELIEIKYGEFKKYILHVKLTV